MSIETTIVEQMRLQEGRLFQNEQILALYLDVKAIIHETMLHEGATLEQLEERLFKLGPKGVPNYHARVLYDSVRIVAKLLWPSQLLMVAKPKVTLLLKGLQDRLVSLRPIYIDSDPIKQDFFMREAFRRTLINDCLYVFDESVDAEKIHDEPMLDLVPNGLDTLDTDAVGPDDSASHIGSRVEVHERPAGARSRLGPIEETVEAVDLEHVASDTVSVVRSVVAKSVANVAQEDAKSVSDHKTELQSVVPRMIPVHVDSERKSTVSHVSAASTASVLRKPVHVKKIIIDTSETNL
jgi:hypothetical protein